MKSTLLYLVLKLQKVLNSDEEVLLYSSKLMLTFRLLLMSAAWVHLVIVTVVILPTDMSADADPRIRAFSRLKYRFITAWFNFRICIFGVTWIHLLIAATVLLPIDMSQDDNPKIRAYTTLKWKFLTAWFNFIMLAYFPLCLYCDWREYRGEVGWRHVVLLRKIRDIVFTSVLFPTTMFADILFWRLYTKDPELISPTALFSYMPSWGQHSLHSVSLVVIILDLLLTPRSKPKSLKSRMVLLILFLGVYGVVIGVSYLNGDMVYQMLGNFNAFSMFLLCMLTFTECLFYFFVQWLVIDYMWKSRAMKKMR